MTLMAENRYRWDYDWEIISRESDTGAVAVQFLWDYWYGGPREYPIVPEDYWGWQPTELKELGLA